VNVCARSWGNSPFPKRAYTGSEDAKTHLTLFISFRAHGRVFDFLIVKPQEIGCLRYATRVV